jgi:hypothetical protein
MSLGRRPFRSAKPVLTFDQSYHVVRRRFIVHTPASVGKGQLLVGNQGYRTLSLASFCSFHHGKNLFHVGEGARRVG